MIDVCNVKQRDLLSLPVKEFTKVERYESLIIVPTKKKHDSGWRLMAIVGCKEKDNYHNVPVEIAGYCDDINWILPYNNKYFECLRSDMTVSNCIRFWSNYHIFEVGMCCSSTDIKIIKNKNK